MNSGHRLISSINTLSSPCQPLEILSPISLKNDFLLAT